MDRPTCKTCPFYEAKSRHCRILPTPSHVIGDTSKHQEVVAVDCPPEYWCAQHPYFPDYMQAIECKQEYHGLYWRDPSEDPIAGENEVVFALALVSLRGLDPFIISATYEGGAYSSAPGWDGLSKDMKLLAWMPEPEFKWPSGELIKNVIEDDN